MIEGDHWITAREIPVNRGVIHHQDVELAIVIAIEQRDAAAHHLDKVTPLSGEIGNRRETRLRRDIAKLDRRPFGSLRACKTDCAREQHARADERHRTVLGPIAQIQLPLASIHREGRFRVENAHRFSPYEGIPSRTHGNCGSPRLASSRDRHLRAWRPGDKLLQAPGESVRYLG